MAALFVSGFPIHIMNGNTREAGYIDDTMEDTEKSHSQTILLKVRNRARKWSGKLLLQENQ